MRAWRRAVSRAIHRAGRGTLPAGRLAQAISAIETGVTVQETGPFVLASVVAVPISARLAIAPAVLVASFTNAVVAGVSAVFRTVGLVVCLATSVAAARGRLVVVFATYVLVRVFDAVCRAGVIGVAQTIATRFRGAILRASLEGFPRPTDVVPANGAVRTTACVLVIVADQVATFRPATNDRRDRDDDNDNRGSEHRRHNGRRSHLGIVADAGGIVTDAPRSLPTIVDTRHQNA